MSEITQNPSTTHSTIAPKSNKKQLVAKNKSPKRSPKPKTNKNKSNKITNNSNKPLKVVYISNPVKFQVNADEFQALVQGLTGQDAVELNYNNNSYSARDSVPPDGSEVHHDEVEQEPLMDDEKVHVDRYDHVPSCETSLDYFGHLDDISVVFGDVNSNNTNKGDDYGEFPSFYD